jgi:glycosyltransferase involved in cell wall biosynthesis
MSEVNKGQINNDGSPLISYALFTYNQERYIEAALESALSQTYRPLQLIISDDCSSDNTGKIIDDIVNNYNGDIKVFVNKNKLNVGVIRHVEQIIEICNGELIVTAAGDDISKPERTQQLFDLWNKYDRPECAIFSNAILIDQEGVSGDLFYSEKIRKKDISDYLKGVPTFIGGFSQSFTPSLFKSFPKIETKTFQEDAVLAFRAILKKGIYFIDEPLVYYRRHEYNAYSTLKYKSFSKLCISEREAALQALLDLKSATWLTNTEIARIRRRAIKVFIKKFLLSKMAMLFWLKRLY